MNFNMLGNKTIALLNVPFNESGQSFVTGIQSSSTYQYITKIVDLDDHFRV